MLKNYRRNFRKKQIFPLIKTENKIINQVEYTKKKSTKIIFYH